MTNKAVHHETNAEARQLFVDNFEKITTTEQWMAAVWVIEDGKVVCKTITTSRFPKGDMVAAIGQLGINLHEKEFAPEPIPEPLPTVFPDQWSPNLKTDELDQGKWENNQ